MHYKYAPWIYKRRYGYESPVKCCWTNVLSSLFTDTSLNNYANRKYQGKTGGNSMKLYMSF